MRGKRLEPTKVKTDSEIKERKKRRKKNRAENRRRTLNQAHS
jgi:hypothetical protein